jgi:retron-type reverse transcriptase
VDKAKPFSIPKREVWEAFKRVKANQGAAGVDGQSIADFEANLAGNLYKLWNRMSSGSYFPPPVRRVDIPKANGGTRPLGIPTVADRIAQAVVRRFLEPTLEPVFHADSYGYRPGKSAIDAVARPASAAGATTGCSTSTSRASWILSHTAPWFMKLPRRARSDGPTP